MKNNTRLAIELDPLTGVPIVHVQNDAELRANEDDPYFSQTGRATVFIRCLSKDFHWYQLRQTFFFDGFGDFDEFVARVDRLADRIRRVGSFDPELWIFVRDAGNLRERWES